jgi:hypothetical protein
MFSKFTVKQLKALIKHFKDHHTIKNYSKLKKAQLIEQLDSRFEIKDNQLYLKDGPTIEPKVKKVKKTPTKVAQPPVQQDAPARQDSLTDGQRRYNDSVFAVAAKANYARDSNMAKRLRGNK